jgi:sugar lactone lactonase YvrE
MHRTRFVAPNSPLQFDKLSQPLNLRAFLLICFGASILLATPTRASGTTLTPTVTSLAVTQGNAASTAITLVSKVNTASGTAVTAGTVLFCDTSAKSCIGAPGYIGTAQIVQTSTGVWTATVTVAVSVGNHAYKAAFQDTSLYQTSSSAKQSIDVVGKSYTFLPSFESSLSPGAAGGYNWQATLYGFGLVTPTGSVSLLDSSDGNLTLGSAALPPTFSPGFLIGNGSPFSTGTSPVSIAIGDINGDGFSDLAVANSNGSVSVLIGNEDATFSAAKGCTYTPAIGGGTPSLALGDFLNNGGPFVAAYNGDGLTLFGVDPASCYQWSSLSVGSVNPGTYSMTVGDFNQDGNLDIAIANPSQGNVLVMLGNGSGSFTASGTPKFGTSPSSVATADFNGDGVPDLAVTDAVNNNVTILYGDGTGAFSVGPSMPTESGPSEVLVADFNGDGLPDLLISSQGNFSPVTILLGNGSGSFTSSELSIYESSVAIADFNGDGIPDIAFAGTYGSGGFLLGNGDGTFSNYSPLGGLINETSLNPFVAAADFNGDGRPDTVTTNSNNPGSGVVIGLSEISGQTSSIPISVPSGGPQSVFASYSGDGNYSGSQSSSSPLTCSLVTTPTFFPASGAFPATQFVTLADSTLGATIYYTTDGTTPTSSSTAYSGAVYVPSTETLEAIATAPGCANSVVSSGTYTISIPTNQAPPSASLGTIPVGTVSPPTAMTFTFNTAETVGSIAVLTQGAPGLDFANAGTGTCTVGQNYSAGATCTVNIAFAPRFAGTRYGAAVLYDNTGSVIETGYVTGNGSGPQLNFLPGTQSMVASTGLYNPDGVAVDGYGNVYIADSSNKRILKQTLSGASYIQSVLPTGNLESPIGVAVDAAGSVYIADAANNGTAGTVLKETPSAVGYSESIVANRSSTGLSVSSPFGIAVDGSGNVYIAYWTDNQVIKETLTTGGYLQSTIGSGLLNPRGVAVDGSGNVYIADSENDRVLKETLGSSSYIQSVITTNVFSNAIAVDGFGNVYIAPINNGLIKETPSSAGYVQTTIGSGIFVDSPEGVAVDGSGNVYIADTSNNRVLKEDVADPPSLSFAATSVGSTSSDSPQTVTIQNVGNAALTFPILGAGESPAISANFTLNSGGASACPLLTSASTSTGTLAAGASCLLPISFTPSSAANLSGSLTLTDNALNATAPSYATQSITLSGTGTQATPAVTVSPSASKIFTVQPLSLTVAVSGGSGNATATGSVTLTGGGYTSAVTTLSTGSATINILAGSLAIGIDTLTANYMPDTASSATYSVASGSTSVLVTLLGTAAATVTATPSAATITNQQTVNVAVSIAGSGSATPSGIVTLASSGYSAQQTLTSGTASFSIPAGALSSGTDTLTATYSGDGTYGIASGTTTVTVSPVVLSVAAPSPVSPGGTAIANAVLAAGSTYSGSMALTCSLTTTPSGAQSLPTCSLNPASVTITSGGGGTTVLTVKTTAATVGALVRPSRLNPWAIGGGEAVMAGMLMLGLPLRCRRKMSLLVLLMVIIASAAIGCGGGGNRSISSTPGLPATTAGSYTITVTGTDSANSKITASANVTITVQ